MIYILHIIEPPYSANCNVCPRVWSLTRLCHRASDVHTWGNSETGRVTICVHVHVQYRAICEVIFEDFNATFNLRYVFYVSSLVTRFTSPQPQPLPTCLKLRMYVHTQHPKCCYRTCCKCAGHGARRGWYTVAQCYTTVQHAANHCMSITNWSVGVMPREYWLLPLVLDSDRTNAGRHITSCPVSANSRHASEWPHWSGGQTCCPAPRHCRRTWRCRTDRSPDCTYCTYVHTRACTDTQQWDEGCKVHLSHVRHMTRMWHVHLQLNQKCDG